MARSAQPQSQTTYAHSVTARLFLAIPLLAVVAALSGCGVSGGESESAGVYHSPNPAKARAFATEILNEAMALPQSARFLSPQGYATAATAKLSGFCSLTDPVLRTEALMDLSVRDDACDLLPQATTGADTADDWPSRSWSEHVEFAAAKAFDCSSIPLKRSRGRWVDGSSHACTAEATVLHTIAAPRPGGRIAAMRTKNGLRAYMGRFPTQWGPVLVVSIDIDDPGATDIYRCSTWRDESCAGSQAGPWEAYAFLNPPST